MARGRHWLILIPGQGAKLFVYVMLRGQSLHPSGDKEVQVPWAFLGVVKAAAWEPGAPPHDRPVRCSPPRGEPSSSWFRGSLASMGTQGTGWDLVEQKHSCMQNSGLSVGFFPPDTYTVFFQRQNLIPAVQGTTLEPS